MTTDKKSDCSGSKRRRENDESSRTGNGTMTEQSIEMIIDDDNVSTMLLQMMLESDGLRSKRSMQSQIRHQL